MRLLKPQVHAITLAFILLVGSAIGQIQRDDEPFRNSDGKLFRPRLYVGVGPLSYFGDVGKLDGTGHGTHLNWGYSFGLENPISPYFSLNAFMLFGTISGEESLYRGNANFETSIGMGGVSLSYNFGHLMPVDHPVRPYVSLGISTFEFNPKTDMYDADGNKYHYWSDGTIRDRNESTTAKSDAQILERDYVYETDLRKTNDELPYSLRSMSVPMGAGFFMRVNDYFDFRMGAEFHYVLSDNLDNISAETGYENGSSNHDHLLFSSV